MNIIDKITDSGITQAKLARLLKVKPQAITYWRKTNRIPPKHVRLVAEITKLAPEMLNPFFKQ